MRTIKQLLKLVTASLKQGHKSGWHNNGICGEIKDLKNRELLNHDEKWALMEYIEERRPTRKKYTEFLDKYYEFKPFWWPPMQNRWSYGRTARIDFLNHLISEL